MSLAGITPSLLARDLSATLAFYRSIGFTHCGGSPDSGWLEVRRDCACLQFYSEAPVGTPDAPCLSGTLYIRTVAVDALAAELRGKAPFEWGPEVMDYGMREFAIRDPNGYLIAFTEPA